MKWSDKTPSRTENKGNTTTAKTALDSTRLNALEFLSPSRRTVADAEVSDCSNGFGSEGRARSNWRRGAIMQQCAEILKPFEQLTKEMSGQFYPTLSLRIPTIENAKREIKKIVADNSQLHEKAVEFGDELLQSFLLSVW